MKVMIIAADEPRNRQKFISIPLVLGGHDVFVILTKPFTSFCNRLVRLLFNDRVDVVIFMGTGPKELLSYSLLKILKLPVVIRMGGDRLRDLDSVAQSNWKKGRYLIWMRYRMDTCIAKCFLSQMDKAIIVNEALGSRIHNQLKIPGQTFVVPQFCEGTLVKRKYDINPQIEILTVTNLRFIEKAKGVIWIIEQLAQTARNMAVPIHFQVLGSGLHLSDIKDYLELLDKSEFLTVTLAGFITELDDYYSNADIFIYHSKHDATPNVILESKRFSLPLLANKCEEFSNIVEHDVSGLLYRDAEDFQMLLKQLIMKKELRRKIGKGALREHKLKFSIEAIKEKIESTLMSILE